MQALPIGPLNQPVAVALEQRVANAVSSLNRHLPRFTDLPEIRLGQIRTAAVVSGGPSLEAHLSELDRYETIVASGSCHDYLIGRGITPTYCVIFDPSEDHGRFYRAPSSETVYLVSSTCADSVFEALAGRKVRVWHPMDDVPWDIYDFEPRIGGGSSVTLRAIALCHIMGFRELHLYGFDCSFRDGVEHAYPYDQDRPKPIAVSLNGQQFLTTPSLLQQAQEFFYIVNDYQHVLALIIHGGGLSSAMWEAGARHTLAPNA